MGGTEARSMIFHKDISTLKFYVNSTVHDPKTKDLLYVNAVCPSRVTQIGTLIDNPPVILISREILERDFTVIKASGTMFKTPD
jgi:late competence protein required for DNA uptake (superfamily II DNA/RNA helicase)